MPNPLKLTFLITDLHLGGTPLILRDLALGLTKRNFDVSIISLKPLPDKALADSPIHRFAGSIPSRLAAANIPVHSLNLYSPFQFPHALGELTKLLNHQQPDILYSMLIHANTLATLALPFLKSKPKLIHSIHTLQENPAWHWTLQGILSPYADALIVPAQPILNKISQYGQFNRGTVIPNGIDIDRFANAAPIHPDQLPWPPNSKVVGYIGRFDPVKNLPLLLRAFALLHPQKHAQTLGGTGRTSAENEGSAGIALGCSGGQLAQNRPQIHLALVGYGPQESALKSLATSLHLTPFVHFLGPTTTPERWYKSFTCHCLPSTVEGFGLTLLESIAAGTPVIALDTPVTRTLVRPQIDGLLLPTPAYPQSLATALQQVISELPVSPLAPTKPSQATLSHLRTTFSTARMVELTAKYLKNLRDSAD